MASIYIAGRYGRREEMMAHADKLKNAGHTITSRWVYGGEEGKSREEIAIIDYKDVREANTVLSFTEDRGTYHRGGGRHVEFGIAYEAGKTCICVGEKENVFHHLPGVHTFPTLEEAIEFMKGLS